MKRVISILIIISLGLMMFTGCADTKVIEGVEYDSYGFLNKDSKYNPEIEYDVVVGNVVWSIILVETIVAPVYFIGFSIFEPVGKIGEGVKGQVRH